MRREPCTERERVLVTDGNQRASLAVVRALGRAGIRVAVGESESTSLAGSSRYCAKRIFYPSPFEDGAKFQEFLSEELKRGEYRVLIPMTDVSTRLVARAQQTLNPLVALPIPAEEQIVRVQDKGHVFRLAQGLGIPSPRTEVVCEGQRIEDVAARMQYPVVIKPRFSRYPQNGRWVSGAVEYVYSASDLISKYNELHARIPSPLIQERLQGEGRGVFLLLWHGELKAAFCHRRLREKPPWGGVSVYCESVVLDEALVQKSVALLRALGWHGVAMTEFKVDARDNQAKLMEINGRFWGSLQLAIDSGMNFPLLLYRLACGENLRPRFEYKIGVKSRWLLGDLDHLLIRLAHANLPNVASSGPISRLRACADFLKFYERNLHYEVFRLDDPRPGWFELELYIRDALRRFGRNREMANAD